MIVVSHQVRQVTNFLASLYYFTPSQASDQFISCQVRQMTNFLASLYYFMPSQESDQFFS
jgi:cbb3-type cytochrome oxidase subunit 1